MQPSCVKFESVCCIHRYLSLACSLEGFPGGDSTQAVTLYYTVMNMMLQLEATLSDLFTHARAVRKVDICYGLLKFKISFIRQAATLSVNCGLWQVLGQSSVGRQE